MTSSHDDGRQDDTSEAGDFPTPLTCIVLTLVSAATVYFWSVALTAWTSAFVTFGLAVLGGRVLVAALALERLRKPWPATLGLFRMDFIAVLGCLACAPALLLILKLQDGLLTLMGHPTIPGLHVIGALPPATQAGGLLAVLGLLLLLPIGTEVLFRGIIRHGLVHRFGRRKGMWATAALAATGHYFMAGVLDMRGFAVLAAGLLGLVREWRGLFASGLTHAAMSALWLLLMFAGDSEPTTGVLPSDWEQPSWMLGLALLSVAVGMGLLRRNDSASKPVDDSAFEVEECESGNREVGERRP
jgi:membrane protease YdiL (CAAX protease family)